MSDKLNPVSPVLLVDDEQQALDSLSISLATCGVTNTHALTDPRLVEDFLDRNQVEAVILDMVMPGMSGDEVLEMIVRKHPDLPVIVLTGIDEVDTAVKCMRNQAFDYVVKPASRGRLASAVLRALEMRSLRRQNRLLSRHLLKNELDHPEVFESILTVNETMRSIFGYVEAVAPGGEAVLITGATGTGKELLARSLHGCSGRNGDFVAVNLAGLDDQMFTDTLFGHARGAFTGADKARPGLVESAEGGTLLLDEIGDLSAASQVKLLRLLQEREYLPLGSDRHRRTNARILAATQEDLPMAVDQGRFRKDLFYRLSTHHVHLPSLNQRKDDLPLLIDHFMDQASQSFGKPRPTWPHELVTLLKNYNFPGNVRELRAMVFDAVGKHGGRKMSMDAFKEHVSKHGGIDSVGNGNQPGETPFSHLEVLPSIKEAASLLVDEAMLRAEGNQRVAASLLGISHQALNKRLSKRRPE